MRWVAGMFHKDAYRRLKKRLEESSRPIVAFSGGLDSTLLLYAARDVLGDAAAAVTAIAPYMSRTQVDYARKLALDWGVDYFEVLLPFAHELMDNPRDRCYLCKREMYREIGRIAREHGFRTILDGSNADDLGAHRPGMQAIRELGISTPLADEGITKDMVRVLLSSKGVQLNESASGPCLLTRLPYGVDVTVDILELIGRSEAFLHTLGIVTVRVRADGEGARIEVGRDDFKRFFDAQKLDRIDRNLKELGWKYVSLDLAGYRAGAYDAESPL